MDARIVLVAVLVALGVTALLAGVLQRLNAAAMRRGDDPGGGEG